MRSRNSDVYRLSFGMIDQTLSLPCPIISGQFFSMKHERQIFFLPRMLCGPYKVRRGCPAYAIKSTFRAISWNQKPDLLKRKIQGKVDSSKEFSAEFRGCVFSTRNAPGCNPLQENNMNLSLKQLEQNARSPATTTWWARMWLTLITRRS